MKKTNALRSLDRAGVKYRTAEYDSRGEAVEATEVARKIRMPPEQVFKTLVASGADEHYVFVVPGGCELDLKKAALAARAKKVALVAVRELPGLTGYVRCGCSPLAMKRAFATYIDETCRLYDEVAVSAGVIGLQVILNPDALVEATPAIVADLV